MTVHYEVSTTSTVNTYKRIILNDNQLDRVKGIAIKYQANYPQRVMIVPDGYSYRLSDLNMAQQSNTANCYSNVLCDELLTKCTIEGGTVGDRFKIWRAK